MIPKELFDENLSKGDQFKHAASVSCMMDFIPVFLRQHILLKFFVLTSVCYHGHAQGQEHQ